MDADMKWFLIAVICVMGIPLAGMGWSEHQRSQCRLEGIKASMPADDIAKVCGK